MEDRGLLTAGKSSGTDAGVVKQLGELGVSISARARDVIQNIMPQKILDLDVIYKTHPAFNNADLAKASGTDQPNFPWPPNSNNDAAAPATKKRKVDLDEANTTDIPCNDNILELLGVLKSEIMQLTEMLGVVKIWIQLSIPRIEDGNNFGVSIQEETVNEVTRAEDSGFAVLEAMTKYFVTRAKLISKVLKYPAVKDYQRSVRELDEKEYTNLRFCCVELRNNYAILYDMITKNMEKIVKPRSNNVSNMF